MPIGLHPYIIRFTSFLLAVYILNFSVGVPDNHSAAGNISYVESEETENILEIVLEVDFDGYQFSSGTSGDGEKETEGESSTDTIDVFSYPQGKISLFNNFHTSESDLHALCRHFISRAQEINSPPPKG